MKNDLKKILTVRKDGKVDKKKLIILLFLLMFFFSSGTTLARYAYTEIRDFYLNSKKFYFNCDKLSASGSLIEMTNWSGVGEYQVTFNMNSYANNNLYSDDDITYNITYTCSSNVTCSIVDNKTSSTILGSKNTDEFTIVISVPTDVTLHDNDSVELNVEATSTSPYKKKLSGTFRLVVGYYGLSYEIDDEKGSPYLETRITNTLDYYKVTTDFDTYHVGDQIDIPTYLALTDEQKQNCASAIITLTFDPTEVLLDMTSEDYLNAISTTKTTIDGYDYITSITFKMDALSSEQVKFYKINTALDNTYPNASNQSIITVSYQ